MLYKSNKTFFTFGCDDIVKKYFRIKTTSADIWM